MDYSSNSHKAREEKRPDKPEIVKVVTGEVIQKPKTLGRKFRDIFFGGNIRLAAGYVAGDVLLPALRNLIVDATSKGVERVVYGDNTFRRRPIEYRPRTVYNSPIYQRPDPRDSRVRPVLPDQHSHRVTKREATDIVLSSKDEADLVVERLIDIIDKYDVASLADLYDLVGLPSSHVDNKWGWSYLNNVEVRQVRDGYLIDLPTLEAI
ncbi:MAG: hypothetical protein ABWY25_04345 [Paenisporosarcina sp.]